MYLKKCFKCDREFIKKYNQSKKYWETAKYCSIKCGRLSNNPAKLKPNNFFIKNNVVYIEIYQNKNKFLSKVDFDDYTANEVISKNRWSLDGSGYAENGFTVNSKRIKRKIHWEILGRKKYFVVDHINGDRLDNRKCNLRHLSFVDNLRNQKIKNKIGIPNGKISKNGSFVVRIKANDDKIHSKTFKNKEKALKWRIEAEKTYWGYSFLEEKLL